MKISRFWWYRYNGWTPVWWQYVVPGFGSDEYGRRTLVVHVPFAGFLVWAYKECHCEDCVWTREHVDPETWEVRDDATT